jgi:hypothetical protein
VRSALWLIAAALPLAAQPKLLVNAKTDTRSASAGLESAYRALLAANPQPAWIGWSEPAVRSYNLGCDYVRDGFSQPGVVHLEPPDHLVVLLRVEENKVNRVRALSPNCEIDAGGVPVHWLEGVQPAQSIALLDSLVAERERIGDGALLAIAMHADPASDAALEKYLAPGQPQTIRSRVVGYYGSARGAHGFDVLKKVIAGDPDVRIRERAVSSLANSREPDALNLLISIAKTDTDTRMRTAAISGLGRKSGQVVLTTLSGIAQNDPDKSVKRRALSSLQQMPEGEGIPVLIEMARTGRDPEMRKQAMTSLEHSRDPRALALFEDVLKK